MLSWCPSQCGSCYELCSTGGTTQGNMTAPDVCRTFKITNRCGDGYKQYPMWCSNELSWQECLKSPEQCRQQNSTNWYGYPAHFDLQDLNYQITSHLKWNNVEVTFEPVSCSKWKGPAWDCHCDAGKPDVSASSRAAFTFDATADTIAADSIASTIQSNTNPATPAAFSFDASADAIARASTISDRSDGSPLQTSAPVDEDAGFCCTASSDWKDICGSCDSNGVSKVGTFCGQSREKCGQCGTQSRWCPMTSQVRHQTYLRLKESSEAIHWSKLDTEARHFGSAALLWALALGLLVIFGVAAWSRTRRRSVPQQGADVPEEELLAPGSLFDADVSNSSGICQVIA